MPEKATTVFRGERLDCFGDTCDFMTAEIVADHDIPLTERRGEDFADIDQKCLPVHRTIKHPWCFEPVVTERRNEGVRMPVAMGPVVQTSLRARSAPIQPGHFRVQSGFIKEHEVAMIPSALLCFPQTAGGGHVRTALFACVQGFF